MTYIASAKRYRRFTPPADNQRIIGQRMAANATRLLAAGNATQADVDDLCNLPDSLLIAIAAERKERGVEEWRVNNGK